MATIRLIPSTYAVSSTSYLSVSNANNMYTNTDSTTYATITNTYSSTSSRYLYLRGFNFDDIPSAAVINSFTVKIKGYESGLTTSTSYAPRLANGSSVETGNRSSSGTQETKAVFCIMDIAYMNTYKINTIDLICIYSSIPDFVVGNHYTGTHTDSY